MYSKTLVEKAIAKLNQDGKIPCSCTVHLPDGSTHKIGNEDSIFELQVKNKAGLKALLSLDQITIAEAYCLDNIDIQGDIVKTLAFQETLSQNNFGIKIWRRLKPILVGRKRCNPAWIAKHYDANNIQVMASDRDYNTYTQGNYEEGDSLEIGAERKLDFAFQSLKLETNASVLDIGSGWGGFIRFAARRRVNVTGITLSKHQKEYTEKIINDNQLTNAQVYYQDFFTYQTNQKYDGAVMMGVIEDLSDYYWVMKKLVTLIKPGGRVYLDFATSNKRFSTSVFITKYIWPGTFRMVYLPEFVDAINKSPFEINSMYNDRFNYYYWTWLMQRRWVENKTEVLKKTNEFTWRLFNTLFAGTSAIESTPSYAASAYRVVLELPADHNALAYSTR